MGKQEVTDILKKTKKWMTNADLSNCLGVRQSSISNTTMRLMNENDCDIVRRKKEGTQRTYEFRYNN